MVGAGALGRPRGMVWGGKREEGSGWGKESAWSAGDLDLIPGLGLSPGEGHGNPF